MTTTNNEASQFVERLSGRYFRVDDYCIDSVWIEELDENREPTENYLEVSYKVMQLLYHAGQLRRLEGEEMRKTEGAL